MNNIEIDSLEEQPIILIVDDTRANLQALASLLSDYYQIQVAGNGPMALEIARTSPQPDLILLDVNMPEMDGYEVCRRLNENALTSSIPVIFITAVSDIKSETYGLQLGAVDYIIKPINPAITLLRIRNHILFKQSATKLRLASSVFDNTSECIMITDLQGTIINVNPAFSRVTGYTRKEVLGKNMSLMCSNHHDQAFFKALWETLVTTGSWSGEIWNTTKTGEPYPELLNISAVKDSQGKTTHYISISSNISKLKDHEMELEHIAHYDALTGIPNRVLLADRMRQALAQVKRDEKILGVCYLDLDGFKPVNDTLGHHAGDLVLIEIARRIQGILRQGDTVARLGGDEFVVLLPNLHTVSECLATVMRIQNIIALPISIEEKVFSLSASIGISVFPGDANDADVLLRHADQAMYVAKQCGKNCYHLFGHESKCDLTDPTFECC